MVKVSIVIPVYNKEKWISRCLDSLIGQTLSEIEIIVVNDASTDASMEIVRQYQEKGRGTVKLIENEKNRGPGSTRNIGMKYAEGEYVTFVDGDDWVSLDYCEKLYVCAQKESADMVFGGMCLIDSQNPECKIGSMGIPVYLGGRLTAEKKQAVTAYNPSTNCGILFRKTFINRTNLHFLDGENYNEDVVAGLFPLLAGAIGVVPEENYFYWYNNKNSVSSLVKEHYDDRLRTVSKTLDCAREWNLMESYYRQVEYIFIRYFYLEQLEVILNFREYAAFPVGKMKEAAEIVRKNFPDYQENKLLLAAVDEKELHWMELNDKSPETLMDWYFSEFSSYFQAFSKKTEELLKKLKNENKKAALWGAGKKTRTFLHLFDTEQKYVHLVFDRNPRFYGQHLNTGHRIADYQKELDSVDVILVPVHLHYASVWDICAGKNKKIIDLDAYYYFGLTD